MLFAGFNGYMLAGLILAARKRLLRRAASRAGNAGAGDVDAVSSRR